MKVSSLPQPSVSGDLKEAVHAYSQAVKQLEATAREQEEEQQEASASGDNFKVSQNNSLYPKLCELTQDGLQTLMRLSCCPASQVTLLNHLPSHTGCDQDSTTSTTRVPGDAWNPCSSRNDAD